MKAFQITSSLLAILVLTTQGVRHLYVKYFERTASVMDRFTKKELETEIEKAASIDELLAKYEPAKKREDELDAMVDEQQKRQPEEKRAAFRSEFNQQHQKEYHEAIGLRQAILDWESKAKEVRELRIFWGFGLGLLMLGGLVYLRSPWLGMAFIVPGVAEMIWWTSPSFHFGGTVPEYERLLNNKLGFTMVSLLIVLAAWFLAGRIRHEQRG